MILLTFDCLQKSFSTCQMIAFVHHTAHIWCKLLESDYIMNFYRNSTCVGIYLIFLLSFYGKGYEAVGERVNRVDRGRKWQLHSNPLGYNWSKTIKFCQRSALRTNGQQKSREKVHLDTIDRKTVIEWTVEENGSYILICLDTFNRKRLSFVKWKNALRTNGQKKDRKKINRTQNKKLFEDNLRCITEVYIYVFLVYGARDLMQYHWGEKPWRQFVVQLCIIPLSHFFLCKILLYIIK